MRIRLLIGVLLLPVLTAVLSSAPAGAAAHDASHSPPPSLPAQIRACVPQAVAADPDRARELVVEMHWDGDEAAPIVRNDSAAPVAVKEVVLFDVPHGFAADTRFYGEGLQMLMTSDINPTLGDHPVEA